MAFPVKLRPVRLAERIGWNHEALAKKKASTPSAAWRRGWELRAVSDDDLTFPSFKKCYSHGVALGALQRNDWICVTGVDPSSSKRPGGSIVTVKVHPATHRRYPVNVRFGAWKMDELLRQLSDVNHNYKPSMIFVEDNAVQEYIVQMIEYLKLDFWFKVEATTTTGGKKASEEIGLPSLQVEFENGGWVIPADEFETHEVGHHTKGCAWCRYVYEFNSHPLGVSTDGVMATWFAKQGIEKFGLGFDLDQVPADFKNR